VERVTEVVFPAGSPDLEVKARLLDPSGRSLPGAEVAHPLARGFRFRVPRGLLEGAWVEFQVREASRGGSSAVFRRPLRDLPPVTEAPTFRVLRVRVRSVDGAVLSGVHLSQRCRTWPQAGAESEPEHDFGASRSREDGSSEMLVPRGRPFTLLVQTPGQAPMARRFAAGDANEPLEFIAQPGLQIPVRVLDPGGRPFEGASVLARASLEGMRILRADTTDAGGRASVGPFAPGPVEVFARGPGHAWAAAVAEATDAMATLNLRLERGYPLSLVIEDPAGHPLAGVDVEVHPTGGGLPLASPPRAPQRRSPSDGTLLLPALPNRLYDVTLTLPGHRIERLRRVRPGAVTYYATLLRDP